jgi:Escherichia/Staphylococcus phage prohead protease
MQTMHRTAMPPIERKNLEYKLCFGEIKEMNDARYQFSGHISVKNNLDYGRDIVRNGAYRKTLQDAFRRKAAGDPFLYPYMWNHSTDQIPPGGIYDADEDKHGMYAWVQLNPEMQLARELYSSLKMKTLSRQSVGYLATDVNWIKGEDGKGQVRELLAMDVKEGSCVIFPMNDLARIDQVKRYWPGWTESKGSASGKTSWPLADRGVSWDKGQARRDIAAYATSGDTIDWSKVASCHFWTAKKPPEKWEDCKFPFVMKSGGEMKAVPAAIFNGAARLGAADIDDVSGVRAKMAVYYGRMNMPVPWGKGDMMSYSVDWSDDEDDEFEAKEGRVLSTRTVQVLRKATSGIEKHVGDIQAHMNAHAQNLLAGYPVYSSSDDTPYDISSALAELNAALESKEGRAISEANRAKIAYATDGILKHVKVLKSVVNESQRYNESVGQELFASSEPYDTKEEDPVVAELKALSASLDASRERSTLSRLEELTAKIGIDLSLANLYAAASE